MVTNIEFKLYLAPFNKNKSLDFLSHTANMIDHCKLRGGVYFTDFIPRTESCKPIRKEIKEKFTKLYIEKIKNCNE